MTDPKALITAAYAAFNKRDIDAALALMTDTISWPKASEGGRVTGKDEIRAYWTRQWQEFDPTVQAIETTETQAGKTYEVSVHQIVKDLAGTVLFDGQVQHEYTIAYDLIQRMDLGGAQNLDTEGQAPSVAFKKG